MHGAGGKGPRKGLFISLPPPNSSSISIWHRGRLCPAPAAMPGSWQSDEALAQRTAHRPQI